MSDKLGTLYSKKVPNFGLISSLEVEYKDTSDNFTINLNWLNFAPFSKNHEELILENQILKNIIKNLWENHKYNQEYSSYLLGIYSKEEFISIAKSYAKPINSDVDKDDLIFSSNLLLSFIDEPLTSHDLSVLLNVDCSSLDENMRQIHYPSDYSILGDTKNDNSD